MKQATIGQGAFSIVVSVIQLDNNIQQVVKKVCSTNLYQLIIKKKLVNRYDQLKQESTILASLRQENIVKFINVKETDIRILIIMELEQEASLENLMQKLHKNYKWFTEDQCKIILKNILQALAYICIKIMQYIDIQKQKIFQSMKNQVVLNQVILI